MIKLSLKGLCKFMVANFARQRAILKDFKYPDPEGKAQMNFYRPAKDLIIDYHKNSHKPQWLINEAKNLGKKAKNETGQRKTKILSNCRSLEQYAKNFGKKNYSIINNNKFPKLSTQYGNVMISVTPDLFVKAGNREKIIILEFTGKSFKDKGRQIMSKVLYDAQLRGGFKKSTSDILCFDVQKGNVFMGARIGSMLEKEIIAACQNIEAIWKNI